LLYDYVCPHSMAVIIEAISPDLALSDYHMFGLLQEEAS
jgi:hypothetical protein